MLVPTLQRFIDAQKNTYEQALTEIREGKKRSHWMWYIFPQMLGLGSSSTANYYAISNFDDAVKYFNQPLLGKRLVEISKTLLQVMGKSANDIFGSPDDKKLKSSMTLFSLVPNADPVFAAVLKKFFKGERDKRTLDLIETTM